MRPFVPRASPLVGVDLSLLADEVGETASHTPDGGQGVLNLRRVFFVGKSHSSLITAALASTAEGYRLGICYQSVRKYKDKFGVNMTIPAVFV